MSALRRTGQCLLRRPLSRTRLLASQRPTRRRVSSDSSSTTADRPVQLRSAQASTDDPKAKLPEVASSAATPEEHNDALTQRLEDATESALLSSTSSRRAVLEEAGFSEELKARLLEKISATSSVGVDSASISSTTTQIPASAGQGTRDLATAAPWAGEESTADTVLRMLQDKHKPLPVHERGKFQIPTPRGVTRRESFRSPGHRAASARDRAAQYAEEKAEQEAAVVAAAAAADAAGAGKGLSEEEQQALRREFKERFRPEARIMPATFTGLAELANKRIEDAIARGQFKNIPRGKGVERDARADNPFIDTTEYIMNKMIKRQDLAPPWIEKQQELVKEANAFRSRLRSDWKRHAARMIASSGGSLESQIERAREYARAEEVHNPRRHNVEDIAVPTNSTEDVMVAVRRQDSGETTTTTLGESAAETPSTSALLAEKQPPSSVPHIHPQVTLSQPFRDPAWEERERAYMELAIQKLNSLARSYNLMAPDLAKKPYFSLERELRHCYADVAPLLADEIRTRALAPAKDLYGGRGGHAQGTYVSMFGSGDWKSTEARIYDDKTPHYGLREMWADLWKGWKDGRAKEGSR